MRLYNRYIPSGASFTRISEEDAPPVTRAQQNPSWRAESWQGQQQEARSGQQQEAWQGQQQEAWQGRQKEARHGQQQEARHGQQQEAWQGQPQARAQDANPLAALLKRFHLDALDTGDLLLIGIVLLLFIDGEDKELAVILGLLVLFGLGKKEDKKDEKDCDSGL